jgi:hypothetical protein
MTVCIAAIYNNNSILGASDRMVTGGYGDITFEPPSPKIIPITNSIAVMTAGDQSIQMRVFQDVNKIVGEKIRTNPTQWINVSDVAEFYSKCFYALRNKLTEDRILSRYSLTLDSFISKQKEMDSDFINMITNRISRFEIDDMRDERIETIITGIDDSGPHIFVVANGEISSHDRLGFASIGIGSGHANLHFMLSAYSPRTLETKALLTIHQAKKKSEVSPGVGKDTDMCVIGPLKGTFMMLVPIPPDKDIVKDLDKFYNTYKKGIKKLDEKAEKNITDYLNNLARSSPTKQEASPPPISQPFKQKTTKSTKSNRTKKNKKGSLFEHN